MGRVVGKSMEATLADGWSVLVNREQTERRHGTVFVIRAGEDELIMREALAGRRLRAHNQCISSGRRPLRIAVRLWSANEKRWDNVLDARRKVPVLVLLLKILGVMLPPAPAAWRTWKERRGDKGRGFAKKMVGYVAVPAVVAAGLVVDHLSQTAAVMAARETAVETQQELQTLLESSAEGRGSQRRLEESAAEGRLALQRIEEASAEVIALMRESDPDLSGSEALERVVQEVLQLREQAASLEDQLVGLRLYRETLVSHSLRPRPARVAAGRGLVANGW